MTGGYRKKSLKKYRNNKNLRKNIRSKKRL